MMRLKTKHLCGFVIIFVLLLLVGWKRNESNFYYPNYDADSSQDKPDSSIVLEQPTSHIDNYKLSYHPDLLVRGDWQQKQIDKFCEEQGFGNLTYSLDIVEPLKGEFYRHMIMDDETKNMYCFLPKVGCKTTRVILLVSKGKMSRSVVHLVKNRLALEAQIEKGLKKSSFLHKALTDESRIDALKTYGKYIIIRHPLQRILSAYLDKLSGPLLKEIKPYNYFEHLKHDILKKYRKDDYAFWIENENSELKVTIEDYVLWLSKEKVSLLNEHFSSQYDNSQPCRVRYHFYGNFDQFETDFTKILERFGIDNSLLNLFRPSEHDNSTQHKLDLFWSPLSLELKHKLFWKYKIDFDFYHALYPFEYSLTERYLEL